MIRKLIWATALACLALPNSAHLPAADIKVPQATQITLADGTIALTQIVYAIDARPMMIIALPNGDAKIFYLATNSPTPPPIPPIPPTPVPTKLTIAIVTEPALQTPEQARVITDATFQTEAKNNHDFLGIVTPDAADSVTKEVPAKLAPFLTEAKLHQLPWIIFATQSGTVVWQGPPPATPEALMEILHKYGGK
jgi:hypothetical protein